MPLGKVGSKGSSKGVVEEEEGAVVQIVGGKLEVG